MSARRLAVVALAGMLVTGLFVGSPARHVEASTVLTIGLPINSVGGMVVDQATSQLFMSSPSDNEVIALDFTGNLVATITGETGAGRMIVIGGTLYVLLSSGAIDRIDTSTDKETSALVTGLTTPHDLVYAHSLIWTTTGGGGSMTLASVDPAAVTPTVTTYAGAFNSTNSLSSCAAFAVNHAVNPDYFVAFSCNGAPSTIEKFDVSSGSPAQSATASPSGPNLDVTVGADGAHVMVTFDNEVDEYNLTDLSLDGVVYPGGSTLEAVDTTRQNGSRIVAAMFGAPGVIAFPVGDPTQELAPSTGGGYIQRALALSSDGLTAFLASSGVRVNLTLEPIPAVTADGTPDPPTGVAATAGVGAAKVTWTAPIYHGTSPITGYEVDSSGGAVVTVGPSTFTALLTGLSAVPHTFTVMAINSHGNSAPSDPSNSVTPLDGGTTHTVTPSRILDTRTGNGGFPIHRVAAGGTLSLQVTGRGGVPATGVSAVVMNLTATNTAGPGFVIAYPDGFSRPLASNLNYVGGKTVPNLVEVGVGVSGRVDLYVGGAAADLVADVEGWVGDSTDSYSPSGLYIGLPAAARIYDSRYISTTTGFTHQPLGPNQSLTLSYFPGLGSAEAVVLNVTATGPTRAGYLTVYPAGAPRPATSNLNFAPGQTVPNRVIVGLGSGGAITITNGPGSVDVVVDYDGFFGGYGAAFVPVVPYRFFDTRTCHCKMPPGYIYNLGVSGPMVTGISFNTTVTAPTANGFVTVYSDNGQGVNSPIPGSSDLNFTPGETVANMTPLGMYQANPQGVNLLNGYGYTDVILDVDGFYGPATGNLNVPVGISTPRTEPRIPPKMPRIPTTAPRTAAA